MKSSKFLRLPEVLSRVPLSKSTVLRQVAEGSFPQPARLGARRVAWLEHEIVEWEQACIAERDADNVGEAA
jgi:prophage regulatory protein